MSDRLDVLTVREDDKKKSWWTKIGSAWPAKDGNGFNVSLDALPLSGKLFLRVPKPKREPGSDDFDFGG